MWVFPFQTSKVSRRYGATHHGSHDIRCTMDSAEVRGGQRILLCIYSRSRLISFPVSFSSSSHFPLHTHTIIAILVPLESHLSLSSKPKSTHRKTCLSTHPDKVRPLVTADSQKDVVTPINKTTCSHIQPNPYHQINQTHKQPPPS